MRILLGAVLLSAMATPSVAECLGDGCYAGAGAFLVSLLAYFCTGIFLLVQLFRRKLRSFIMTLGVAAAIAVGIPMLSWGIVGWKNLNLARTEMVGEGLSMVGETVVHLHLASYCGDSPCEAVARHSDAAFVAGIVLGFGNTIDLSQPIDLAELVPVPLNSETGYAAWSPWEGVVEASPETVRARMAEATRVVITQQFYYAREQGVVELALKQNAQFSQMAGSETLALAIGRLHAPGVLDLSQVEFQYIDLTQQAQYWTVPLMFGDGTRSVPFRMTPEQREILAPVLCQHVSEWQCDEMLGKQWFE